MLWRQIAFVASHGQMMLRRDRCAIFHGCMPVDAAGNFLELEVDGVPRKGRALFEAIELVVQRAVRERAPADLDLVFYLWTGPRSPCFGKDKMAAFEAYFVEDRATHEEVKNPYFKLIHEVGVLRARAAELGVIEDGFLINGHVPVRLERGERPIKESGRAITIDGAFAAAYGDKGFSLVLDAHRMYLAQHHHFESAAAAVARGDDIVPTVADVEAYPPPADGGRHRERLGAARRDRRARGARPTRSRPTRSAPREATMTTLLEQLNSMTVAVADTGDLKSIEKFKPRDATTNPSLITAAAQMPEYADVVDGALRWAEQRGRGRQGRRR